MTIGGSRLGPTDGSSRRFFLTTALSRAGPVAGRFEAALALAASCPCGRVAAATARAGLLAPLPAAFASLRLGGPGRRVHGDVLVNV